MLLLLLLFFFFSFFFFFWFFCAVVSLVVTLPLFPALVLNSRKKWATFRKTQNESQWIVSQRILSTYNTWIQISRLQKIYHSQWSEWLFASTPVTATRTPRSPPPRRQPLGSAAGGIALYLYMSNVDIACRRWDSSRVVSSPKPFTAGWASSSWLRNAHVSQSLKLA